MAKRKVNASFAHTKQDELAPVASYIVDTMGKNANVFPNVPVSLTQVVAERGAFRDVVETLHATSLQDGCFGVQVCGGGGWSECGG